MAAVGYGSLPVSVSARGISKQLEQAILPSMKKVSKQAGKSLEAGIGTGVDAAAKNVEKANFRVKKSTEELATAESKLTEQKLKTEAANIAVEAAARKREEAEGKGIAAVEKAEQELLKKRAAAEREARNLIKAEESHESALSESARAAESLADRQEELKRANENAGDSFDDLAQDVRATGGELDEAAEKASSFGDKLVAGLAEVGRGALLGIGSRIGNSIMDGVQEAMSQGWETALSIDQVSRSLSAMTSETEVAEQMMADLRDVAGDMPVDYTAFLNSANTLAYMGYEGDEAIKVLENVATAATGAGNDGTEALESAADALGKMQANGKVTQDEISTISSQGVPMLDMLIEHFGMAEGSYEELKDKISDGGVELDDVFAALGDTGSGTFQMLADSAENMNQSLDSQMKMLKDDIFVGVGEALQPILNEMDFEAIADTVGDVVGRIVGLLPGMVDIAMSAFDKLGEVIGDVSGVLEDVWGWIEENRDALKSLAVGVGLAVGAWTLFTGAMKLHAFAIQIADKGWKGYIASTKVATAVTKLFNKATRANVIGLIATALIAVGGALVYFFTQTETGREMWEKFTTALADGWEWVTEALGAGWELIRDNVFDPLMGFVTGTLWPILEGAFGLITGAWDALGAGIQSVWENVILAAWDAVSAGAAWLWENGLQPIFGLISDGWQALGEGIRAVYDSIIKPAWDALAAALQWLWETVIMFYFGLITSGWSALGDGIRWVYDSVIKPAWDALGNALTWLYENVVRPVLQWMGDRWTDMADVLEFGWIWIRDNVFDAMGRGLETLRGWFETGVEAIKSIWDGLREAAAAPVRFVVDTVWNEGLRKALNFVLDLLPGFSTLDPVELNFASGGVLPGYTPGRDPYTFVEPRTGMRIGLSGGEAILRPEATRALGEDWVNGINAAARSGGESGVANQLRRAHFADGGVLDLGNFNLGGVNNMAGALSAIQRSHAMFVGRFFPEMFNLTSAMRFTDTGHHSTGKATDWQGAGDGHFETQMPTPGSKALANAIFTNFPNSAELIHWPLSGWQNLSEGAPFDFGPATNAQHANHVHWATHSPLQFDGDDIVLTDIPTGGGGWFNPVEWAKGQWDRALDAIGSWGEADQGGFFNQLPGEILSWAGTALWDWAAEQLGNLRSLFGGGGGGAQNVSNWSSAASEALRRAGYDDSMLGITLDQVDIESSGDPTSRNDWDSNAAIGDPTIGLLQVRGDTFDLMRRTYPEAFEGLPNDRTDPVANMTAGILWTKYRYGGPQNVWPTRAGYADGGIVDLMSLFDTGGVLRHGKAALNLSGADEIIINNDQLQALSKLANNVGALVKQLERDRDVEKFAHAVGEEFRAVLDVNVVEDQAWSAWMGQGNVTELETLFGPDVMHAVSGALRDAGQASADFTVEVGRVYDGLTLLNSANIEGLAGLNLVTDAYDDYLTAQAAVGKNAEEIAAAEETLAEKMAARAEAQAELDELMAGSTEQSKQDARKIADAEKALSEAREAGDPEKIADAEEKLSRAREDAADKAAEAEDKRADAIVKAQEKIAKADAEVLDAQSALTGVSGETAAALKGVASAQFAVAASAVQAAAEIAASIVGALGQVWSAAAEGWALVADMAGQVEEGRRQLQLMRLDNAMLEIERRNAVRDLGQAQADSQTAALTATLKVAEATRALYEAQQQGLERTTKIGETGIDAMGRAMDRWRETGVFSVETVTEVTAESAARAAEQLRQVGQLEWAVRQAEVQGALDQLNAQEAVELATIDAAEATLLQNAAVRELEISTQLLSDQAAVFYGMTQSGATALERQAEAQAKQAEGFSGILKSVGVVAGGAAAGFGLGGPMGALIGGIAGLLTQIGPLIDSFAKIVDGREQEQIYAKAAQEELENLPEEFVRELENAKFWDRISTFFGGEGTMVENIFDRMKEEFDFIELQAGEKLDDLHHDTELALKELDLIRAEIKDDNADQRKSLEALVDYTKAMGEAAASQGAVAEAYEALAENYLEQHQHWADQSNKSNEYYDDVRDDLRGLREDTQATGSAITEQKQPLTVTVNATSLESGREVAGLMNQMLDRMDGIQAQVNVNTTNSRSALDQVKSRL